MSSTQLPQVSTWRPETRACLCPKEAHSWSGRPEEKVPKHVLRVFLTRKQHCVILTWCLPRFCRTRQYTSGLLTLSPYT